MTTTTDIAAILAQDPPVRAQTRLNIDRALENLARTMENEFDESSLDINGFTGYLANRFGMAVAQLFLQDVESGGSL